MEQNEDESEDGSDEVKIDGSESEAITIGQSDTQEVMSDIEDSGPPNNHAKEHNENHGE